MGVGVIVTLKPKAGKEKEIQGIFQELAKAVRANEPGNKVFQLCRARQDPSSFVVVEMWETEDAMKAHGASPHFQAIAGKADDLLASTPDIYYLDVL